MQTAIFLELNEFSVDLLKEAKGYPNIQKLVSLREIQTHTDDTYESDFLEPWVQWVSVHTGKPSSEHQIKHLGDVPDLSTEQLWESLSKQGITSGVWGAMNASRGGAEKCLFFIPDPWTASEKAHPEELNDLLEPLRFVSKSYARPKFSQIGKIFKLFHAHKLLGKVVREIPRLCKNLIRFRGAHCAFISFLDLISTHLFLSYKKRYNPQFSLIFLNSLAHLQHHHWHLDNPKLQEGLSYIDRILGLLFEALQPEDLFLVANALSQKNTNKEKPWILYRQKDPKTFLIAMGLTCDRVEPHMTHDAHLYFESPEECQKAKETLEKTTLQGQKLFLVETYADPCKLFYRICFTDPVPPEISFQLSGKSYRFFDLFQAIVQRTGKHIPYGTAFANALFPQSMKNHEIFHHIQNFFYEGEQHIKSNVKGMGLTSRRSSGHV